MIRVLIVDDSQTMRVVIRNILESDPELRVVGEARNGREAINLCKRVEPDIVTMDIRMPEMDGFQAIQRIMAESPRPIVVLTSTKSDRELGISFKAIDYGALAVTKKPFFSAGIYPNAEKLIGEVKAMAQVKVVGRRRSTVKETSKPPSPRSLYPILVSNPLRLIAMGASTGGPPALNVILTKLPSDLPVPVVVVQHISVGFMKGLVRWLNDTTPLRVRIATNGVLMEPGTVYLPPDQQHLTVGKGWRAWLQDSPPVGGHRPSVTVLFDSVAEHYGRSAAGVLLTGMGADGARGLKAIRDAGGYTIAQDEDTSVVFGMPKEAIKMGGASEVAALGDIGERLTSLMKNEGLLTLNS